MGGCFFLNLLLLQLLFCQLEWALAMGLAFGGTELRGWHLCLGRCQCSPICWTTRGLLVVAGASGSPGGAAAPASIIILLRAEGHGERQWWKKPNLARRSTAKAQFGELLCLRILCFWVACHFEPFCASVSYGQKATENSFQAQSHVFLPSPLLFLLSLSLEQYGATAYYHSSDRTPRHVTPTQHSGEREHGVPEGGGEQR